MQVWGGQNAHPTSLKFLWGGHSARLLFNLVILTYLIQPERLAKSDRPVPTPFNLPNFPKLTLEFVTTLSHYL
ncbi:hypothetical protein MiSe_34360 [Microseira wollei NIES-4236]|uniref:Transposase n=1 Tax=Microseira wollei NIES-4236 TaxID=2530354 RepID=A0AAV3XE80_9CYAN|nr:hypothetical protein MiSe_34360 [Microseira wollei NIES-4236]